MFWGSIAVEKALVGQLSGKINRSAAVTQDRGLQTLLRAWLPELTEPNLGVGDQAGKYLRSPRRTWDDCNFAD